MSNLRCECVFSFDFHFQMFAGHWVAIYGARRTFATCLWLSALVVVPLGISASSTNFKVVFLHIFLEGYPFMNVPRGAR